MTEAKACNFEDPGTLKDILDLLVKLDGARSLKAFVGQKLSEDVKKYCNGSESFYNPYRSSGLLWNVFQYAGTVRSTILKSSETFDTYNNLDSEHGKHEDCIAEALKKCLPKAYAALYFLFFMGSQSLGGIQGGDWHDYACNGTDYYYRSSGSKVDLYLWLNDRKGENTGLVKRGFPLDKHSFTNKKGSEVATQIKTIITHSTAGPLQKVLLYLLFSCEWDNALTGHALCFLYHFCDKVTEYQVSNNLQGKLKGEDPKVNFENLNAVCIELQGHLYPFTHSSDSGLRAVCHENSDLFEEMWKEDSFGDYVKWLKENLPKIIEALNQMLKDSKRWNRSDLRNASSAGPFKYGFVFKDNKWNGNTNRGVQSAIHPLLSPLRELQGCLQGSPAPPVQSSRASESHVSSAGSLSSRSGSSGSSSIRGSSYHSHTGDSRTESENADTSDSSGGPSKASIVGASVGTLGGTAALGGLGYFLRGFLFGV
ncbi:secreted antigen 3 [Babesia divergens]|uniref:Secreted antigen 3 n=1 Tax=Babesia divergens TaxID=32595 RepID=A0AAD9GB44_BABDI|nr:secreted antigen 3 [Babesia divergens]